MARYVKGQSGNPAGRPKGIPNKTTKALVEQILQALEDKGGLGFLAKLPPKLFVALLARVVPKDVQISGGMTYEGKLELIEQARQRIDGKKTKTHGDIEPNGR